MGIIYQLIPSNIIISSVIVHIYYENIIEKMEHQVLACSINQSNQSKTYADVNQWAHEQDCAGGICTFRLRLLICTFFICAFFKYFSQLYCSDSSFVAYNVTIPLLLGYSMNKQFNLACEGVTGVFRPDSNSFEPKARVKTYSPFYRNLNSFSRKRSTSHSP